MRKRLNKKGVELPWGTIIIGLILIIFLVIYSPWLIKTLGDVAGKIGDYMGGLSPGLKKISFFGTEDEKKGPVKKTDADWQKAFDEAKNCEAKETAFNNIKDIDVKDKLWSGLFDFCINHNNCAEAKKILDEKKIESQELKDGFMLNVVECYINSGNTNGARELVSDIRTRSINNKANGLIGSADKVKVLLDIYKEIIEAYNLNNNELAKQKISELNRKTIEQEIPEDIKKQFSTSADFWLKKIKEQCGFDNNIKEGIKFPISGKPNAHDREEIGMWSKYELILCSDTQKAEGDALLRGYIVSFVWYYSSEYKTNRVIASMIDKVVSLYRIESKCQSKNGLFACDDINKEFGTGITPDLVGIENYKKLKCYLNSEYLCKPCTQITTCKDYPAKEEQTCIKNPCGFQGGCKINKRILWFDSCEPN